MAVKRTLICDICGEEANPNHPSAIFYTGESQMDPSGGGYEHENFTIHLCSKHLRDAMQSWLQYKYDNGWRPKM